jgi:hypothetical protein
VLAATFLALKVSAIVLLPEDTKVRPGAGGGEAPVTPARQVVRSLGAETQRGFFHVYQPVRLYLPRMVRNAFAACGSNRKH